ncbi:MAG TPA: type II secretion system secretin GspD [Methylovirgula sp.]|nr:type II secretion system secretin GspD [Methylovirgula sp.]
MASGHYGPDASTGTRGVVYVGTDEPNTTNAPDGSEPPVKEGPNDSYQLNFENADIATVCKTIFGDILKANYIIDPRVSGQISLASSVPIPRSRLVPLLEAALLSANASVIKEDGDYRIAPTADPGGLRHAEYQAVGEGYGVTVIGAKYITADAISHLLQEYGSRAGSVKLDPLANLVIVQGTAAERQAALDAVSMVDVDWLRSKSVAILPLKYATPEQVIAELNGILDTGKGGISENMVQMQPLSRMNAVLAVSPTKQLIDKVVLWTRRLDQQDYSAFSIQPYHLQYAQAKTVAAVLNSMFGGGTGEVKGQSDKDQLAPGGQSNGPTSAASSPFSSGSTSGTGMTSGLGTSSGLGTPGTAPQSTSSSSSDNSSSPFGTLKTSFDSENKDTGDTSGGGGAQAGPGGTKVHVTADVASNTLFIYADRQTYAAMTRAIRDLDRAPTQVDIDVTIAEVTLNKDLQYGVQVYLNSGSTALSFLNGAQAQATPLTMVNPGVNLLAGAVADPRVIINALSNITNVKVLSSPSLVVADRQPATLEVGDQVPVLAQQAVSTLTAGAPVVNSVNYVNTGIILNVLPSVNADGVVSLQIEQEISSVTNPGTASNPNLTPTISQRRVRSSVSVPSGQTVLLAGLIQDQRNTTRAGLPGLTDLQFFNQFLTNHDTNIQRDELIIFIRPRIINNAYDSEQVSEEFRNRLQSMQPELVEPYRKR